MLLPSAEQEFSKLRQRKMYKHYNDSGNVVSFGIPPMGPGHENLDHNNIINDSAKMKSEKLTYEINRY